MAVKLRRYTTCDSSKIGICTELPLRRRQGVETLAVLGIIPVLLVAGFFFLADSFANRIFATKHRFQAGGHYFRVDMLMTFYLLCALSISAGCSTVFGPDDHAVFSWELPFSFGWASFSCDDAVKPSAELVILG